jgi:Uma2 family endonuclease
MTAEQLIALNPSGRCELVEGVLHMMSPSGWRHGDIVGRLHAVLGHYIVQNNLGMVMGAETGFLLARNPDTVRAPDVAFIAHANLPKTPPKEAFWPGAPDLAVEVISPGDKPAEVKEKMEAWLTAGTKLLWKVDGKAQTVTVYRSLADVSVLAINDTLDGGDIVPGFRCPVVTIFNL